MTRESIRTFIVNKFYVCNFATLRVRHAHVFVRTMYDFSDAYYERYNGLLYDHHVTCYLVFISYFLLKIPDRTEKHGFRVIRLIRTKKRSAKHHQPR